MAAAMAGAGIAPTGSVQYAHAPASIVNGTLIRPAPAAPAGYAAVFQA